MKTVTDRSIPARGASLSVLAVFVLYLTACGDAPPLQPWHTEVLSGEFTAEMSPDQVGSFKDYMALEQGLFRELDEQIYAKVPSGPEHRLRRFSRGSAADPDRWPRNWNRTFELEAQAPVGGVLLLHGMSDSPYSLRALGEALNGQSYRVLGLRLPGHGTAPSGLRRVTWQDMAAAVRLAMVHLASGLESRPIHIIGYSTGASLALDYALKTLEQGKGRVPASLVLISPAIGIHPASTLARFKSAASALPGLGSMAYLSVMAEFDPFNYNSFATNAGAQVHAVTRNVGRRLQSLASDLAVAAKLPPILVLKSTVDSTVSTDAVVDKLLMRLPAHRNELVLFDINRKALIKSTLLVADPAPLTSRLLADESLPFSVTLLTNENPVSAAVVARRKAPFSLDASAVEPLGLAWPRGVVSLSHVALPFPPDDPLYGQGPPAQDDRVFLGDMAIKGERGLLKIPTDWLLRLRYNPFYPYMKTRVLHWLEAATDGAG